MFFKTGSASWVSKTIDLFLDLVWFVGQQNATGCNTTRHLRLQTLKSWEESRVNASCLQVLQLCCNITCHSEVWVLINGTRNKTSYILLGSKYVRECIAEGWHCLNWWVSKFANVVLLVESEDSFDLVVVYILLHTQNIRIQVLDVVYVRENEGFFWVKAKSNDILNILFAHLDGLL